MMSINHSLFDLQTAVLQGVFTISMQIMFMS